MPVEIVGFAQALARYLDFDTVEPRDLELAQSDADEPFELRFVEPSADEPLIRSGSAFTHLLFVHRGIIVPWQYPYSELGAPFLIGEHEFLTNAERWVASYSAVTEAIVVYIPVSAMRFILERIPGVRERMHELVMRRVERFYWTSLATSGTPASRVAAALVSQLAFIGDDHGNDKTIDILQRELARLTTMSRFAVADGLRTLKGAGAITFGDKPPEVDESPDRFAGEVHVPDVKYLKDQAFAEVRDRTIRPALSQPDDDERPLSITGATRNRLRSTTLLAVEERLTAPSRPRQSRLGRVPSRGNTPLFDGYVAVNWSASVRRIRGPNSIWIAVCDARGVTLENPNTREKAVDRVETLLNQATQEGRRLLCGVDFSFGYPEGTARMLTDQDSWEAVWERIAEVIDDRPNNSNNRFDAAAVLNARFCGDGPFWGNGLKRDVPGLTRKKPRVGWDGDLPPRLRYAEDKVSGAQEVWKLWGMGSVGGQALTGIARLERLRRRRTDVQVWPFETLGEGRLHVLAEIYPSLIDPCPGNEVLDARQVKAVAEALRALDNSGQLGQYLDAPNTMPPRVRREEGAILGMHDPEGFRAAAAREILSHRID